MNFSYWEIKSWFTNVDFTIVGSGIVGLSCAISLKQQYPRATILILEKGVLPQGASTKNAGFACFGSLSEIIDDLKYHTENEVLELIEKRRNGLNLLRKNLGDKSIDYQQHGGYELFMDNDNLLEECLENMEYINNLLDPLFEELVFSVCDNKFKFSNIKNSYIFNQFEGQIDTGKMMLKLLQKVRSIGVKIINNCSIQTYSEKSDSVSIKTNLLEFVSSKLLIATNGFAIDLIEENVIPARAQVLITKPIKDLHIKGTFHLDKGYYYFRNIDNRILFGGGRNKDFKTEETLQFGLTKKIQDNLEEILNTIILPNRNVQIEHRWSGIMGMGAQKKAIVKELSANVACGVRLGGMGVAIGSSIGNELASLINQ